MVVPGPDDNVFFDGNSFPLPLIGQMVTIDAQAFCNDMTWIYVLNAPDLSGSNMLEIHGSITLSPAMTASFSGQLRFVASDPGNTVDFSTVGINFNQLEFSGTGEWNLLSDIIFPMWGNVTFSEGTLNTNGKTIKCGMFNSWPMGNRTLNLGNSTIKCQNFMLNNSPSLQFDAGTSKLILSNGWFNGEGLIYYDIDFRPEWQTEVSINGSGTYNTLNLDTATVTGIRLQEGELQTLYDLIMGATCLNRKNVGSMLDGQSAIIKKISGTLREDYLAIRDITVIGGATFITDNGINMGNVTNWTINSGIGNTYYWVGGTGNWNEPDHWSETSGGVYPSGNLCTPANTDHVVFDAASFTEAGQTVTISTYAYCNNMIWIGVSNNPALLSSGMSELNIFGSLTLDAAMSYSYSSAINFRSAEMGKTITTAGNLLSNTITFDGTGEWTFLDELKGNSYIYFQKGSIITNNNNLSISSLFSYSEFPRHINLGSSIVTCSSSWSIQLNSNYSVDAGTSLIHFSGTFGGGSRIYNDIQLNSTTTSYIYGSNTFNMINNFGKSDIYLEAGSTQTINGLIADGFCSDLIQITSTSDGVAASLSKASGSVTVSYAIINDVHAGGGALFDASNSVDNGNSSGWNFTSLPSKNFYWINGAGNWNQPEHWSYSSGGVPNPDGCIPSMVDDVFFNASSGLSGFTVGVTAEAFCLNMNWTGIVAGSSLSGSVNLNIYGSMILSSNMTIPFNGNIFFKSSSPANINTAGRTLQANVYFSSTGTWTLLGNFNITLSGNKYLYFNQGNLITNNFSMSLKNFYSSTQNNRQLNLGSSTITAGYWNISDGTNLIINPGTSLIRTSNSSFHGGDADYNNLFLTAATSFIIYGSNSFNAIDMSNSTSLSFEGGNTTTFNSLTFPNGTGCSSYFNLSSSTAGVPAHLVSSGVLNKNWLRITNVTASGTGTFTANSSLGIGDVTGWNIISPPGVTLFWFGGTGNWSDGNHWSQIPGGPLAYGCPPSPNDDVIFDENSFALPNQTVTVDVAAYCKNLTFTNILNNPKITGWSEIVVNGSFALSPAMAYDLSSYVTFTSQLLNNTITTAGHTIIGLRFNGSGTYTLLDNVSLSWNGISFNNGTLNTNNFNIDFSNSNFSSNSTSVRNLILGSSVLSNVNSWQINDNTNMVIEPGTSQIILSTNCWEFRGGDLNYHDVTFYPSWGATTVYGSNTFNTLELNPGTAIAFEKGKTQFVQILDAYGVSGNTISLGSNEPGTTATINQTGQEFCGDYLNIRDINATGTTFYAGEYSVDQGNNSGWTWSGVTALNQYPDAICEDIYGSGTVASINLTLLEDAIDGIHSYSHSWFTDADCTVPVPDPALVSVSNGLTFYDAVSNGVCVNYAEVIYSVNPLPDVTFTGTLETQCPNADTYMLTGGNPTGGTYSGTGVTGDNFNASVAGTGLHTITYTYTDGNSCTHSATNTITVEDVTAPVPDVAVLPDATEECSVTLTAPLATDNCSGTITGTTSDPLTYSEQGTYSVTWTYEDNYGNSTTQVQSVIVDDISAPVPDVASLPDAGGECSLTPESPTATDNCEGSVTGIPDISFPVTVQGTTIVTWTYDDGNGNIVTQVQNIIIEDVTAPLPYEISLPDITAECSVTSLTAPTATDNCQGSITGTHDASLPITAQGTTVVTWIFDDGNGNISTQIQNVIIDDITAPVPDVAVLSDATGECSVTVSAPAATDNCIGPVIATTVDPTTYSSQGTFTVHWIYDDGNENISTQNQTVIVNDVTAPVPDVATLSDITDECSVSILTAPSATDNCTGSVTASHNITLPVTTQGTTVITWIYDDGNGNISTQAQNIMVDDITAPVADVGTLPDLHAECPVTELTAPTATDNCEGSISGTSSSSLPVTESTVITWTFDDGNGNTSAQTQNVIIEDVTDPVISGCPADISVNNTPGNCSAVVSWTEPTATDNCSLSGITGTFSPGDEFPLGTTLVTYTAFDASGNSAICQFSVTVTDNENPVITCNQNIAVCIDETVLYSEPTVSDNCGASWIQTEGLPSGILYPAGITTNTFMAIDGTGNTASCSFTVNVYEIPVADAGTDQDYYEGHAPVQIGSAENPSYTYAWSPSAGLDNAAVANPLASPAISTNYTVTVTNGECQTSDNVSVTVIPTYNITGSVVYDNTDNTPLNDVKVYLLQGGLKIDSVLTDADGSFSFLNYLNGNYLLDAVTAKAWDGGNATDALLIQNHFVGNSTLTEPRLTAADVNVSLAVNSTDALLIKRRFANLITGFPAGDWYFNPDPVLISGNDVVVNFKGICFGDVNASYTPSFAKMPSSVSLIEKGLVATQIGSTIAIPFRVENAVQLGAVSLIINFPETDIQVLSVASPILADMITNIADGKVYIAWNNLESVYLQQGDILLILEVQVFSNKTNALQFGLMPQSELANEQTLVLYGKELSAPKLQLETSGKIDIHTDAFVSFYPNPTNSIINIVCNRSATVIITDITSKLVFTNEMNSSILSVDVRNFADGTYFLKVVSGNKVITSKVVVRK